MATTETKSAVPLVVLAVLVLGAMGYLGWRVYDAPVDELGAGRVAVRATDVLVRAAGGDATQCQAMEEIAAPDDAEGSVRRCKEMAAQASSGGPGWLDAQGLQSTNVDVDRNSGSVAVSGRVQTTGPAFEFTFTWPVERVDDAWVIAGAPDVQTG